MGIFPRKWSKLGFIILSEIFCWLWFKIYAGLWGYSPSISGGFSPPSVLAKAVQKCHLEKNGFILSETGTWNRKIPVFEPPIWTKILSPLEATRKLSEALRIFQLFSRGLPRTSFPEKCNIQEHIQKISEKRTMGGKLIRDLFWYENRIWS